MPVPFLAVPAIGAVAGYAVGVILNKTVLKNVAENPTPCAPKVKKANKNTKEVLGGDARKTTAKKPAGKTVTPTAEKPKESTVAPENAAPVPQQTVAPANSGEDIAPTTTPPSDSGAGNPPSAEKPAETPKTIVENKTVDKTTENGEGETVTP